MQTPLKNAGGLKKAKKSMRFFGKNRKRNGIFRTFLQQFSHTQDYCNR